MHELSILMNIVDAVDEQAGKHQAKTVESIALDIGDLCGIDTHALEFIWKTGVKNTVLERATCLIRQIEGWARCVNCQYEFKINEIFDPCPICNEHYIRIIRGNELKIRSITFLN